MIEFDPTAIGAFGLLIGAIATLIVFLYVVPIHLLGSAELGQQRGCTPVAVRVRLLRVRRRIRKTMQ